MKFTLSWLKDHLDTTATLHEICDKLVNLGLEVEGVENPAEKIKGLVVAHVVERDQHPNADRLSLCKIDDGSGKLLQVVCGAPNVRQGLKIAFAREGTVIPITGQALKKGVIRDIESYGMICSARELMLSEDHDGIIMELDENLLPGMELAEALGLNDPVIELSITPNRSDCFGVRGIARDLAASGLGTLKPLSYKSFAGKFDSPLKVTIDDSKLCPDFHGVYIRNVKNGIAPAPIRGRLEAVGQRSINALVDVTNYITLDLGRPLHVYDAKKLHGDLVVTPAHEGEVFKALNGKDYTLSKGTTIIRSADKIVSLGAIMGGRDSGATDETVDVFLECALWDPIKVATTGRDLQILSDARTRFERGVDPYSTEYGIHAGVQLILDWCGGEPSHTTIANHTQGKPKKQPVPSITLTQNKLWSLSGFEVPLKEAEKILSRLGFTVTADKTELTLIPPSFRPDIEGTADLVEEILRLMGYDNIPAIPLPQIPIKPRGPRNTDVIRQALASRGLNETQTWAFISEDKAQLFGGQVPHLTIENPISVEMKVMRPSILPNLLDAALRNHNRDLPNSHFFEIASQFSGQGQQLMATGLRSHHTHERHWQSPPRTVDVFDAKADAIAVLAVTGLSTTSYQIDQEGTSYYHPGRSGTIRQGNRILGYFGEIHPRLLKQFDIDFPVVGFEVFLDLLPEVKLKKSIAVFSNLQPVTRDFAFVVDQELPADKIVSTILKTDKQLITNVSIFDVYAGDKMEQGKKSVAVQVRLEPTKATLTDKEIHDLSQKIIDQVAKTTGGKIRE
ncbi:MAG: phenylalanine--tRNA ligase subunit beta [Candidatus Paracaedibacteraceae bacterium]|nr:phenylalanine--tRNA ligase subunit beta [Candidatus Paracaedibacteraceae bacterium]